MKTHIIACLLTLLTLLSVNGQSNIGTLTLSGNTSQYATLTATLSDADGLNNVPVTFRLFDQSGNQLGDAVIVLGSGNDATFSFLVYDSMAGVDSGETLRVEASYSDEAGNIYGYEAGNLAVPTITSDAITELPDMISVTINGIEQLRSSNLHISDASSVKLDEVVLNSFISAVDTVTLTNSAVVTANSSFSISRVVTLTINNSSVINTGTGDAILGRTNSANVFTLNNPLLIQGHINGGVDGFGDQPRVDNNDDTLNLNGVVTLARGSDIVNIEDIIINGNTTIESDIDFTRNSNGDGDGITITINDGASLTIGSIATIVALDGALATTSQPTLLLNGINTVDNSAGGTLIATTTTFSATTYIVSSLTREAFLGNLTLGTNLTIKLTDSLAVGDSLDLFDYTVLDETNLSSVILLDANGDALGTYSLVNDTNAPDLNGAVGRISLSNNGTSTPTP